MPQERRKVPRYAVDFPVTLVKCGQTFAATARNLSVAGMGIRLAGDMVVNEVMVASFRVPGAATDLALFAKLVWRSDDLAGLRFFALADDERAELTRWADAQR